MSTPHTKTKSTRTTVRPSTAPHSTAPISSFDLTDLKNRGYIIGKKIGTGAYGTVSKAYYVNQNKHNELLACKIINKKKAPKDFLLKFFPRELDIITKISHPNIIQTHSILQRGEKIFIFMRYAENGDLLDYLQAKKAIPELQTKFWCRQLAEGLNYLHSLNIAHRDMKCENILITLHMNVKIADFGFCRYCCNEENHRVLSRTYCGSGAYAAPEVIAGVPYNPKLADNWSLGVIIFIMINGAMPFDDTNLLKLKDDQKNRKYKLNKKCSDNAREVINCLLEPDIILRWKMNDVLNSKWIKSGEKSELQM